MTVNIKAMVFRDVTLYRLVHLYQMSWRSLLSILEARTPGLSETVQATYHHTPEDYNLNIQGVLQAINLYINKQVPTEKSKTLISYSVHPQFNNMKYRFPKQAFFMKQLQLLTNTTVSRSTYWQN